MISIKLYLLIRLYNFIQKMFDIIWVCLLVYVRRLFRNDLWHKRYEYSK